MNKLLLILAITLASGCATSMVGVHKGNIAAEEAGTTDEATKRVRFKALTKKAKTKLQEIADERLYGLKP